jgi:hypothetical protein
MDEKNPQKQHKLPLLQYEHRETNIETTMTKLPDHHHAPLTSPSSRPAGGGARVSLVRMATLVLNAGAVVISLYLLWATILEDTPGPSRLQSPSYEYRQIRKHHFLEQGAAAHHQEAVAITESPTAAPTSDGTTEAPTTFSSTGLTEPIIQMEQLEILLPKRIAAEVYRQQLAIQQQRRRRNLRSRASSE